MSDISTLSHEYEANAVFAEELNAVALALKKQLHRPASADDRSVRETRERLVHLLEAIYKALIRDISREAKPDIAQIVIPPEVVDQIYNRVKNTFDYFMADLQETTVKLRENKPIDQKSIKLLDDLCDVTDVVASTAFRRLWRR